MACLRYQRRRLAVQLLQQSWDIGSSYCLRFFRLADTPQSYVLFQREDNDVFLAAGRLLFCQT
jgi:hypothetical protein